MKVSVASPRAARIRSRSRAASTVPTNGRMAPLYFSHACGVGLVPASRRLLGGGGRRAPGRAADPVTARRRRGRRTGRALHRVAALDAPWVEGHDVEPVEQPRGEHAQLVREIVDPRRPRAAGVDDEGADPLRRHRRRPPFDGDLDRRAARTAVVERNADRPALEVVPAPRPHDRGHRCRWWSSSEVVVVAGAVDAVVGEVADGAEPVRPWRSPTPTHRDGRRRHDGRDGPGRRVGRRGPPRHCAITAVPVDGAARRRRGPRDSRRGRRRGPRLASWDSARAPRGPGPGRVPRRAACRGQRVDRCELGAIAALKTFDPPLDDLVGRRVVSCTRRGKFLCVDFDGLWLVVHLARGGWVKWWDALPPRRPDRAGARSPSGSDSPPRTSPRPPAST